MGYYVSVVERLTEQDPELKLYYRQELNNELNRNPEILDMFEQLKGRNPQRSLSQIVLRLKNSPIKEENDVFRKITEIETEVEVRVILKHLINTVDPLLFEVNSTAIGAELLQDSSLLAAYKDWFTCLFYTDGDLKEELVRLKIEKPVLNEQQILLLVENSDKSLPKSIYERVVDIQAKAYALAKSGVSGEWFA